MNISNVNHNDPPSPPPPPPDDDQLDIPWNEKFPRLFWVGFFGCSAYIFQPLYTFVILFSNLYPLIVYVSVTTSTPQCVPMVIHILMAVYLLLIPCFIKYLFKAGGFAYTLFHIVSARKKLYKRPRQLFEAQDSMKFFARVWKHYIYVHVTLLRNQMVEEYFGDLYKEVLSLLSPLQRMDNLIELYEEMYSSQCGRVKIKFADWVTEDDLEQKRSPSPSLGGDLDTKGTRLLQLSSTTSTTMNGAGEMRTDRITARSLSNDSLQLQHRRHRRNRQHMAGSRRSTRVSSSSPRSRLPPNASSARSRSSRKRGPDHHNALLFDTKTGRKKRRMMRKKRRLLLERSLIDFMDSSAGHTDLNGNRNRNGNDEEDEDDEDDDDDDIVLHPHGLDRHNQESMDEFQQFGVDEMESRDVIDEEEDGMYRFSDHEENEQRLDDSGRGKVHRNQPAIELQIAERGHHRRVHSNSTSSLC